MVPPCGSPISEYQPILDIEALIRSGSRAPCLCLAQTSSLRPHRDGSRQLVASRGASPSQRGWSRRPWHQPHGLVPAVRARICTSHFQAGIPGLTLDAKSSFNVRRMSLPASTTTLYPRLPYGRPMYRQHSGPSSSCSTPIHPSRCTERLLGSPTRREPSATCATTASKWDVRARDTASTSHDVNRSSRVVRSEFGGELLCNTSSGHRG